jgi:hypothetical protein
LAFVLLACQGGSPAQSKITSPQAQTVQLPGQKIWKQGISSYLFGTNDTEEWSPQNIETQDAIQSALQSAGFTLIRSFFLDNQADAQIETRISTIEKTGAACLGVITNIDNPSYDMHLVKYLGQRCLLYEFGNEPDYNHIPVEHYLAQWNKLVPQLRKINPQAKFIGPVLGLKNLSYLNDYLQGVKASGVEPDAVSFHWYPCWNLSEGDCLAQASTIVDEATQVRAMVQQILGKNLPSGVTEWNYDPSNPPPAYGDKADFITSFTKTAIQGMMRSGVAFACQFDAASFAGYGRLDMFDIHNNQPKPQFNELKNIIAQYRPVSG